MPNQRRLDLLVADVLRDEPDGAVICAPPIQVLSNWVEETAARTGLLEGAAVPARIDAVGLQMLWQQALERPGGDPRSEAERFRIAGEARAADRLLAQWYPDQPPGGLDDGFYHARRTVAAALERRNALAPEGWMALLSGRLERSENLPFALPRRIRFVGFHELTRLEQRLVSALESRGVEVTREAPAAAPAANPGQRAFPGAREELAAAAAWALEQRRRGLQRIAVVINGLDREPHAARRTFDNLFDTAGRTSLADAAEADFHIPYGEPLAENAGVGDALLLLQVAIDGVARRMPFPRLSRWLLSPHWAGADTERPARGRLEAMLRRDGAYAVSVTDVRQQVARLGLEEQLPGLLQVSRTALNTDWRAPDALHACLAAWGWPGPLARGATARRAVERFAGLLEALRALGPLSPEASLAALRRMAQEQRVRVRGGPLSPVQLLTPEEAVGHRFEAAWVANLHEGNWPGTPVRNPFLPGSAYRDIPRADPAGELGWSERLTDGLRRLAPDVIFSWGQQDGDVRYGASPLLADIEVEIVKDVPRAELHALAVPETADIRGYRDHPWLRTVPDTRGLPLRPASNDDPAEAIAGGSAAFADQAALPLLGYLKHRLAARFDDPPEPFADAAWRGSVLHRALFQLYQPSLASGKLPRESVVAEAVDAALRESGAMHALSPIAVQAERERLIGALREWLALDTDRPPFAIDALEHAMNVGVRGHPLRLKADRIDRLPDGQLLIIDYKSSSRSLAGWARERLGEVQLPLYAVLLEGLAAPGDEAAARVGGIALATVRNGDCGAEGVTAPGIDGFDGVQPLGARRRAVDRDLGEWDSAMKFWRERIDALAAEIVAGDAANRVFDRSHFDLAGYQLLLRHAEGEDWLAQQEPGV